jgi:hypothetical protein
VRCSSGVFYSFFFPPKIRGEMERRDKMEGWPSPLQAHSAKACIPRPHLVYDFLLTKTGLWFHGYEISLTLSTPLESWMWAILYDLRKNRIPPIWKMDRFTSVKKLFGKYWMYPHKSVLIVQGNCNLIWVVWHAFMGVICTWNFQENKIHRHTYCLLFKINCIFLKWKF